MDKEKHTALFLPRLETWEQSQQGQPSGYGYERSFDEMGREASVTSASVTSASVTSASVTSASVTSASVTSASCSYVYCSYV